MSGTTDNIAKIAFVLLVVGMFSGLLANAVPGAPQLVGYTGFINTISSYNVAINVNWPEFNNTGPNNGTCQWWQVWCSPASTWTFVGATIVAGVAAGFQFVVWAATLLSSFVVLLFNLALLNFSPSLPLIVRTILVPIEGFFLVTVIVFVLNWARGR